MANQIEAEATAFESRADYYWIDCNDPMFTMPDYVADALAQWDAETAGFE